MQGALVLGIKVEKKVMVLLEYVQCWRLSGQAQLWEKPEEMAKEGQHIHLHHQF